MECPVCGGPIWDNTEKKKLGLFKATSPDRACREKSCTWAEWDDPKDANHAKELARKASPVVAAAKGRSSWDEIHAVWGRAMHEATKALGADRAAEEPDSLLRVAAAFAVCAALKGLGGVAAPKPAPAPAPVAASVGPVSDGAPFPDAPPPDDDGLPF